MLTLQTAWEHIAALRAKNARHVRYGFRLQEITDERQLRGLQSEVDELKVASPDEQLHEMADVLAICLDFCQREGWTQEQVAAAIQYKLDQWFTVD